MPEAEVRRNMKGIYAGAIAGVVGGIVGVILGYIASIMRLFPIPDYVTATVGMIVLTVIFGAIFGRLYSKFRDPIPGSGPMKGINFGLMIWLIKDIAAGAYLAVTMLRVAEAIALIFTGFFMWIAYGYVLERLRK